MLILGVPVDVAFVPRKGPLVTINTEAGGLPKILSGCMRMVLCERHTNASEQKGLWKIVICMGGQKKTMWLDELVVI